MRMSYTKNENVPKVRAYAVRMVRSGKSTREVARYFGYEFCGTERGGSVLHEPFTGPFACGLVFEPAA
jgi:hypothetical protein